MLSEKEFLRRKAKEVLSSLVGVYSPSGREDALIPVMEKISSELNLDLRVTETKSFLLGSDSKFLLASHLDTVPGFLEPKVTEESISGRGAVDAKGPFTAMLLAGWMLNENGCKVTVAGLSDEENLSSGAKELVRQSKRFEHIVIGEPTNAIHVAIEYRGLLRISVKCRGAQEHSSSSSSNVILKYMPKILQVSKLPGSFDEPSVMPTVVRAGEALNVTPRELEAFFDVRFPYGTSGDILISFFREVFSECEVEIRERIEPVRVSPNTQIVRALMRGLLKQGIKPSLVRKGGTSDMNILATITGSIATYGPGDATLEHTDREVVSLDELYISTMTYYNAIGELCLRS
jgi:LysW-gamma-L-lysine carboxypeptidase